VWPRAQPLHFRAIVQRTISILVLLIAVLGSANVGLADRLIDAREVARGGYYAPRFSPDGGKLLLTAAKQRGLYLAPLAGGAIRRLSDDEGAGVHARFRADGSIEYRAVRAGQRRDLTIGADGALRSAAAPSEPVAQAVDQRIYVRGPGGPGGPGGSWREVGSGDRFFAPLPSPDGDKVAFQGLATGIHVHTRSTGDTVRVGPGSAPAWSADGTRLVYELTEDDGHQVVASELHVVDLASGRRHRLTASEDRIERRPAFSPDGRAIAFDDDSGRIFVARLEVEP
jgi:Tol biopolymer transport system component